MKSRTSSFKTAFRKDLFRFAPLWALYFIGWLMATLGVFSGSDEITDKVYALNAFLIPMSIVNLIYAALCAQALFGDLFKSRLCNALHAMPLRRETWFFSHVAAGLLYSLVPHLAAMLPLILSMGRYWFVPLLWVSVSALEFIFFFGVAVLSCMCTGNRVAMVLVYTIINFVSLLVYGFLNLVYIPQLYGLELDGELFIKLCPVAQLTGYQGYFGYDDYVTVFGRTIAVFTIHWELWIYPAILAGLGLAALGLALLLYRRRALESAGDFVAIRVLDPVFTVIYTLSVGAVFALVGDGMMEAYVPWLLLGLAVGYFTGRMFLGRTVRVFKARNFLCCAVFMAAMGLSVWITALDPLGLTRWTPDPGKVSEAWVQNYSTLTLTEPEQIEKVVAVHKLAIAGRDKEYSYADTTITYKLKDGRTVKRRYKMTLKQLELLRSEYSAPEHVLGYEDWDQYLSEVRYIRVYSQLEGRDAVIIDHAEIRPLLEALRQDCEAGIMVQDWLFRYGADAPDYTEKYNIDIYSGYNSTVNLVIYRNGETTEWIKNNVTFTPILYG